MEDISADQFAVVENKEGLSLDQIELALKSIAHFHALSYAYGQSEKVDYSQLYPIVQGPKLMDEKDFAGNIPTNFQKLIQAMEDSKSAPDDEEMVKALKTLSGNYIKAFSLSRWKVWNGEWVFRKWFSSILWRTG